MHFEVGEKAVQIGGDVTILRSGKNKDADRKWQPSASLAGVISVCSWGLN